LLAVRGRNGSFCLLRTALRKFDDLVALLGKALSRHSITQILVRIVRVHIAPISLASVLLAAHRVTIIVALHIRRSSIHWGHSRRHRSRNPCEGLGLAVRKCDETLGSCRARLIDDRNWTGSNARANKAHSKSSNLFHCKFLHLTRTNCTTAICNRFIHSANTCQTLRRN
jgi:hypothetical protein